MVAGIKYSFAYAIPYTYSRLLDYMKTIEDNVYIKHDVLCKSESQLEVPMLTISDWSKEFSDIIPAERRPIIYIIARQHPSETAGSFVCEGFINYLISNDQGANNLRKLFRFRVVPMFNVDGVIIGNFRTNLSGDDLNRRFLKTNPNFHPSVYQFKATIDQDISRNEPVMAFFDLHGHSARRNVFIYGPQVKCSDDQSIRAKSYAYMLGKKTNMFKYGYCLWRLSKCKRTTARAFMLDKLKSKFIYTVESSTFQYDTNEAKQIPFTEKKYIEMGHYCGVTLAEFLVTSQISESKLIDEYFLDKQRICPI